MKLTVAETARREEITCTRIYQRLRDGRYPFATKDPNGHWLIPQEQPKSNPQPITDWKCRAAGEGED
jgi:hypothetical protein